MKEFDDYNVCCKCSFSGKLRDFKINYVNHNSIESQLSKVPLEIRKLPPLLEVKCPTCGYLERMKCYDNKPKESK